MVKEQLDNLIQKKKKRKKKRTDSVCTLIRKRRMAFAKIRRAEKNTRKPFERLFRTMILCTSAASELGHLHSCL